jgi:hypothetical protein
MRIVCRFYPDYTNVGKDVPCDFARSAHAMASWFRRMGVRAEALAISDVERVIDDPCAIVTAPAGGRVIRGCGGHGPGAGDPVGGGANLFNDYQLPNRKVLALSFDLDFRKLDGRMLARVSAKDAEGCVPMFPDGGGEAC